MHVRRTGHETVPKVIVPTYEFAQVAFRYKRHKPLYHLYIERETCIRLYILYIRHVSRVEIAERKKKRKQRKNVQYVASSLNYLEDEESSWL